MPYRPPVDPSPLPPLAYSDPLTYKNGGQPIKFYPSRPMTAGLSGNFSMNVPIYGPLGAHLSCKIVEGDVVSGYVGGGVIVNSSFSWTPKPSVQVYGTDGDTSGWGWKASYTSPGFAGGLGFTGSLSGTLNGGVTAQGGPTFAGGLPSGSVTGGYTFK
jgi:hypothetical protein